MANKVIRVQLNQASIDSALNALIEYKTWLLNGTKKLLDALAQEGLDVANVNFSHAEYDGLPDVTCSIGTTGEYSRAVIAIGETVLFIEFGTGVRYPDSHPEATKNGMIRGGYGERRGNSPKGWLYKGEPGTHGAIAIVGKHSNLIHTYGNPANACMYNAKRELETKFEEIARRCFA